jgi:hypothetical protein
MGRDDFIRRVLWISAAFNLGGAVLFAFPSSALGQLVGFPSSVPLLYRALLTLFVLLFAGAYAWLALQEEIDRPMVAFAGIGKAAAFAAISGVWLLGSAPFRGVILAGGDLVLAGLFAAWLVRSGNSSPPYPRKGGSA